MWITIIGAFLLYIIGFFLGRKYEKDSFLENVYGVMSQINKSSMAIESVTYYYTKEAYQDHMRKLKEIGEECEEYE